jgi:hypothetical protein
MSITIKKEIIKLNSVTHSVRCAQAILQYGVGAMVDFPDQTLMTAAPEFWEKKVVRIHDERLEKLLGVEYFGMPFGEDFNWGIAYVRFPEWYFCPKCRRFQPIRKWVEEYRQKFTTKREHKDPHMRRPQCLDCRKELVPARIVTVCENGHIDDFPWIAWAHHKSMSGYRAICHDPRLRIETGATAAAGLEGVVVKCTTCHSIANLKDAFNKNIFQEMAERDEEYCCSGRMPWKNKTEHCDEYPRAMPRGASSVYFPKVISSLVIPPYSEKLTVEIEKSIQFNKILDFLSEFEDEDEREAQKEKRIEKWAEQIADEISSDTAAVKKILVRKLTKEKNSENSESIEQLNLKYRLEEYEALSGNVPSSGLSAADFVLEETDIKRYGIPAVKKIVLVHKIREVRALIGFSRIHPPNTHDLVGPQRGLVSIKEAQTKWYPAYEVRGEGIFIDFDNEDIERWSRHPGVIKRLEILKSNYSESYSGKAYSRNITPKFVLLHTIAHLLIRQLSFECGYTAASLRERLYALDPNDRPGAAAIFIYTASGDSEGTLGGVVRQGYWDCFPKIFRKAIDYGRFCSNDPVCITSIGQGREALNLAACHACGLLPETSCEEFNVFLDRAFVVGTFENPELGFYRNL